MPLSLPTPQDLANFSGRDISEYPMPFTNFAIIQAVLMFKFTTELRDDPTDPDEFQLAQMGIVHFADVTVMEQPYQQVKYNPLQSERVGSWNYSKPFSAIRGNAAANALRGEQTGVTFFDLAVAQLALRTERGGVYGSSLRLFEKEWNDALIVVTDDGQRKILGPAERDRVNGIFFDLNGESWPGGEGTSSTLSANIAG